MSSYTYSILINKLLFNHKWTAQLAMETINIQVVPDIHNRYKTVTYFFIVFLPPKLLPLPISQYNIITECVVQRPPFNIHGRVIIHHHI